MDRIYQQFERYGPLSKEALAFIQQHGKIMTFDRGDHFVTQHDSKPNWCFLLEGLVSYEALNKKGNMVLERLCPCNHYFVGTKHAYSHSINPSAIFFLQPSKIYAITNEKLKQGIRLHSELNNVYHILKQHEVDLAQHFIRIQNIDRIERIWYLYRFLPESEGQLTVRQLYSLLGFTNSRQYTEAMEYYYKNKKK